MIKISMGYPNKDEELDILFRNENDVLPKELAQVLAERTRSEVVQVVGKKITLYKEGKDDKKKIVLPEKK